jgi:hypothetical protein
MKAKLMPSLTPQTEEIVALLKQAGLPSEFRLTSLPGGANNRVYRIDVESAALLLKAYFQHPGDPRDRLGAEFAFSRFAWEQGLRNLPRPLACDREHQLGLYEFVEGRLLARDEVGAGEVQQAADFFHQLNRFKSAPAAQSLARGSEACFTLDQHLACVQRRIGPLLHIDAPTALGEMASSFVTEQLAPAWQRIGEHVRAQAAREALPLHDAIAPEDECLSPSDFGFHNALLTADGRLWFIDFEYAGWDDPAKMVCDFFCQPAVPVPGAYFDGFARAVAAELSNPQLHLRRMELLLPVYRIKWCCIMLNDFLPVGSRRRLFARTAEDQQERQQTQLQKVRVALEQASS